MKQVGNTILAKGVNHILAKRDNSAWPKGAKLSGFSNEGGISERGRPADTRTVWQKHSLRVLVRALLVDYPGCKICGHRDLSPDLNGNGEIEPEEWVKQCPCFDVSKEKYSK